jgi:hypothetical protein
LLSRTLAAGLNPVSQIIMAAGNSLTVDLLVAKPELCLFDVPPAFLVREVLGIGD